VSELARAGAAAASSVHAREAPGSTPGPATATTQGQAVEGELCSGAPAGPLGESPIGQIAGIVKVPGVDDVLDALAAEENYVKDRAEMFEGRPQTPGELEQWKRLFTEVQKQANKSLNAHNVHLLGCSPNPLGFGACFIGFDSEHRRYDVTLAIPMAERRNMELAGREAFVRELIGMVVGGTLAKRDEYLRRGGMLQ
jgi:hypothetical protein